MISVSELNRLTRQTLEQAFPLLWVTGEISNLIQAVSGHVYFTLKDATAQARCVMFRLRAQTVPWRLENGQQVEVRALVSLYEPRGDFQLNIETIRRAGAGRLFEEFLRLKQKLAVEGLLATERKKPLPPLPNRIGIISSLQAAALRDVLSSLKRRAPHLTIIIYPTLVQGEMAAKKIAQAITSSKHHNACDLLLLVRGGGSIEDLWAFNEEIVAYAIASSTIPLISGVGHETDTTIADLIADLRAPTPTAAAELATQHWHVVSQKVTTLNQKLNNTLQYRLSLDQQRIDHMALRLIDPANTIKRQQDQVQLLSSRLNAALANLMHKHHDHINHIRTHFSRLAPRIESRQGQLALIKQRLATAKSNLLLKKFNALPPLSKALHHLNPRNTLARGFAIVHNAQGTVVSHAGTLCPGNQIAVELATGHVTAEVLTTCLFEDPLNKP
jgi:exodeoxyribonuclease VII large subunit